MRMLSSVRKETRMSSDSSSSSEGEDEGFEILDPSDPKAHHKLPKLEAKQSTERIRSQSTVNEVIDLSRASDTYDAGEGVKSGAHSSRDESLCVTNNSATSSTPSSIKEEVQSASSSKVKLSKWAARFLNPRREAPKLEELPIEPLKDFILADFSTRDRGSNKVDRVADKEVKEEEEESDSGGEDCVGLGQVGNPITTDIHDTEAPKSRPSTPSSTRKKKTEIRYFQKDITTKCFNCGEVGHMSHACVNERKEKPCHYCGIKGHASAFCPNLRCFLCYLPGHVSQSCPNRNTVTKFCGLCGSSRHNQSACNVREDRFSDVTCMVCWKTGHCMCIRLPRPKSVSIFCPNCSDDHSYEECRDPKDRPMSAARRFKVSSRSAWPTPRSGRSERGGSGGGGSDDRVCYQCNNSGHIASACPEATRGHENPRKRKFENGVSSELPTRRKRHR